MNLTVKKILINCLYASGVISAILLIWYVTSLTVDSELLAPSPWDVIGLTFSMLGKSSTYLALLSTLLRSVIAFAVSITVALVLSLIIGAFPSAKPAVDKIVTIFRAVPTMSIILITLVLVSSTVVPAIVAFLVAFPVSYSAFTREVYADNKLNDMCVVFNVSRLNKMRYILLPQISRAVVPQIKDTLPLCLKVVIAGEALALPRLGIGQQMYVAKVNLDTASVLAITLLALAACFIIQGVVALCEKKVTK